MNQVIEMNPDDKKALMADWLKPQSIIAVLGLVSLVGMGWQRLAHIESRIEQVEARSRESQTHTDTRMNGFETRERENRDILVEIRADMKLIKNATTGK